MNRLGFVQASSLFAAQLLASGCSSMKPGGAVPGSATAPSLPSDDTGWNDDNEQPDRSEAERGVVLSRNCMPGCK